MTPSSGDDGDGDGDKVYADYVKDLLTAEDARRTTVEGRGAAVITSSGALVTLLLAFAALVTKREDFSLGTATRGLLAVSVVAFVVAALLAMATYAPQPTRIVDATRLKDELRELWDQSADFALKKTTATRLDQLDVSQRANDVKAWLLLAAISAEVLGVLLLAVGVVVIL